MWTFLTLKCIEWRFLRSSTASFLMNRDGFEFEMVKGEKYIFIYWLWTSRHEDNLPPYFNSRSLFLSAKTNSEVILPRGFMRFLIKSCWLEEGKQFLRIDELQRKLNNDGRQWRLIIGMIIAIFCCSVLAFAQLKARTTKDSIEWYEELSMWKAVHLLEWEELKISLTFTGTPQIDAHGATVPPLKSQYPCEFNDKKDSTFAIHPK